MKLSVNRLPMLSALALFATCGNAPPAAPLAAATNDYPVVVGAPFTIDGKTYTPVDTMNYDAVGQAQVGTEGGGAISLAHRTLPLPSYVEVTSLVSGRTIVARAERRGPMRGSALVELSPGAAAQLGIAGRTPVRVRRVNPPEPERALLRAGQAAALRLDTPKGLLGALGRKLAVQEGAPPPPPLPLPAVVAKPATAVPATVAKPVPVAVKPVAVATNPVAVAAKPRAPTSPPAPAVPAKTATVGGAHHIVQIGAYSTKARADAAAAKSGGSVSRAGKLFRVRMGPFATSAQAAAALAKARTAGYGDTRIQRMD